MIKQQAESLLHEYVQSESLRAHCYAVAASMRAYAEIFGENPDEWEAIGLLHDFDYEQFPKEHPMKGAEILKEKGYAEDVITDILGHATYSGVPRESKRAQTLFAVDELSGFVVACAHVRPEKLEGMKVSSVKKKLKNKNFAAAVNREEIAHGAEELGVELDEHIQNVITALQKNSEKLGL